MQKFLKYSTCINSLYVFRLDVSMEDGFDLQLSGVIYSAGMIREHVKTRGKSMAKEKRGKKTAVSRQGKKSGLPPGTPVYVGVQKRDAVKIDVLCYSGEHFEELQNVLVEDCLRMRKSGETLWININGVHDVQLIQNIANGFGLHPLTTEDITNTGQRPKAEEFDSYIFLALKMLSYDETLRTIRHEHVSIVFGSGYVLSFQEYEGDVFDPVRNQIRTKKGRIRNEGMDYLAYAILDSIVDEYFVSIEKMGDRIEEIDDEILSAPDARHMSEIHRMKREIVFLRKAVWPLREVFSGLEKNTSELIGVSTRLFLRDLYDHTIQVIDMVEAYRDIIGGMHDTFLSSTGNRMNEVMKVLTIIGTIFIPLTFIAGIYGMNFEHMPELKWPWGYFCLLGIMAALAGGMLALFKRKKWL